MSLLFLCGTGGRLITWREILFRGVAPTSVGVYHIFIICPVSVCCSDRCGSDVKRSIYGRVGDSVRANQRLTLDNRSAIFKWQHLQIFSFQLPHNERERCSPRHAPHALAVNSRLFSLKWVRMGFNRRSQKKTGLLKVCSELSPRLSSVR